MATIQNQQYSPAQMRQIRAAQAVAAKNPEQTVAPLSENASYEQQIEYNRQQLEQARIPAEQYIKQNIYPSRRERAFTPRQERASIQATGRVAKTQLAEVSGQQATFERDVATKAPEYAKPEYKAQALQEAKSEIQRNLERLDSKIQAKYERIQYYRNKEMNSNKDYGDRIEGYEDDISILNAEKRGWVSGLADDNTTIKRFFSGYTAKKADYEADRRATRNKQQADFNKLKETEAFKADLSKLGLSNSKYISMSDYQQAIGKFNSNSAYENQLVKYAQQKGFENLSPQLKAQLETRGLVTKGDTGFQTMNSPGYYNPKTGELMSMKAEDAIRLGFQKVTATGFNPQTGQYVIQSPTGLLTQNQFAAYNLFREQPKLAQFMAGKGVQLQSAQLPTEFVIGGKQAALTAADRLKSSPFYRGPVTTFELAGRRPEYSVKEQEIRDFAANPMKFVNEKGYGLDEKGNRVKMQSGQASAILNIGPVVSGRVNRANLNLTTGKYTYGGEGFNYGELGRSYLRNIKSKESTKSAVDFAALITGTKVISKIPSIGGKIYAGATMALSGPIASSSMDVYQRLPEPSTRLGRFGKAALFFGTQEVVNPYIGLAYIKDFGTNLVVSPTQTLTETGKFIKERPEEFIGGLVGGSLAKGNKDFFMKKLPEKGITSEPFLSTQFENFQNRPTARALEFYDINTGRLLKDKVLLVKDRNSGKLQTPGGGIDEIRFKYPEYKNMPKTEWRKFIYSNNPKAEILRREALLAELKQELNLGKGDVLRIEKLQPNYFADESFFNYRVYVDSFNVFNKIKPSSDAKSIKFVTPFEAYRLSSGSPVSKTRAFGLLAPIRYKEAMGIPAERTLQKYLGVKQETKIPIRSETFGGGLIPDNVSFSNLVISGTKELGKYISKENLAKLYKKGIITNSEYNKLLAKLDSLKFSQESIAIGFAERGKTALNNIERRISELFKKNKGKSYVEESYDPRALFKSNPWSRADVRELGRLLKERNNLPTNKQKVSASYYQKGGLTLEDLVRETNILNRAKQILSSKFDKNQVAVMTPIELVMDLILFKEGKLTRALVERVSPTERIVYGATSRYDLVDQKRFTDITKKLEKHYGRETLAKVPLNRIPDLLNIAEISRPDLIFYKTFMREYLSPKKTFFTHLSTNPFGANSIAQFFKKERFIEAGKTKRAAGLVKGVYIAPELFAKGEKGPRGQIRKETLGYGGLVYFGIGSTKGYSFSFTPTIKRPTTYFMKAKASGEAFLDSMVARAKSSKKEALKVAQELESRAGTVQPTINTLLSKEGEFFITSGSTIKIAKQLPSGRIAGIKKLTYQIVLKKLTKQEAVYINLNANVFSKTGDFVQKRQALENLKKVMGEPVKEQKTFSEELLPKREIQLSTPKILSSSENRMTRTVQSMMLPISREVTGPRKVSERPMLREKQVRMSESLIPKVREFPKFNTRELKIRPSREVSPRKTVELTPKEPRNPNLINNMFRIGRTEQRRQPPRLPPKKKPTRYGLLPTLTQEIYNIKRKGGPVRRTRGFEIARI